MKTREIKFRAWLIDFEMMVFSNNQAETDLCEIWTIGENGVHVETQETFWKEGGGETYEEIRYVECSQAVMQYTGLKDKNGVECYEDDIVKMYKHNDFEHKHTVNQIWKDGKYIDEICVVKFIHSSFVVWNELIKSYRAFMYMARPGESFEVIGNLHQNKDLLK